MYYIFKADIRGKDALTYAEVIDEIPNFLELSPKWSWWSDAPLPVSFPDTTFSVDETVYQDAYQTGSIFDLHSEKLANIIQKSDIRCEYFPVNMVSRKTDKRILPKYFAFHLMETYSAIDYAKSKLEENELISDNLKNVRLSKADKLAVKNIVTLALREEMLASQNQLFRDKERPSLIFVHENLKRLFDKSKIQGCMLTHYKNYRDITISDIFTKL